MTRTTSMERYLQISERSKMRLVDKVEPIHYASLKVEVTSQCNQGCRTCFRSQQPFENMDEELMKTLFEYADNHFFGIVPTGGDPTVVLDQLMSRAHQHPDLAVIITTHGLDVDNPMLGQIADAGNVIVVLSIDGVGEIHNILRGRNYDRVIELTGRLNEYTIPFGVSTVASSYNIHEIVNGSISSLMDRIGASTWSIQRYYPIGDDETNLMDLIPTRKQFQQLQEYRDGMRAHNPYRFQFASAEGRDGQKCARELTVNLNGYIMYCPFTPWSFGRIDAGDSDDLITGKLRANVSGWGALTETRNGFCPLIGNTRALIEFGERNGERSFALRGILDPDSRVHEVYLERTNQ